MFVSPPNRGLKQIMLQVTKPEKGHAGDPGRPRNRRENQNLRPKKTRISGNETESGHQSKAQEEMFAMMQNQNTAI